MEAEFNPKVTADYREREVIIELRNLGVIVIEEKLPVADFIIALEYAYERKARGDFVDSIVDKRIEDEIPRLIASYKHRKLILEDFQITTGINPKSVYGMMSKIAGEREHNGWEVPIVSTIGTRGTAMYLFAECVRLQKIPKKDVIVRGKPKLATLQERQAFLFQGFDDLGPEIANALIEAKITPWQFVCDVARTGISWTNSNKPKLMHKTYSLEVKGIGPMTILHAREVLGCDEPLREVGEE
jgi:ERCC4-type nuclease